MKLTIVRKVGLLLTLVLALMAASTLVVYLKVSSIRENQRLLATVRIPTIITDKELKSDLYLMMNDARQAILAGDDKAAFDKAKAGYIDQRDQSRGDIAQLEELSHSWTVQANRDRFARVKNASEPLFKAAEDAMNLAVSGQKDAIAKAGASITQNGTPIRIAISKELEDMGESQQKLMDDGLVSVAASIQLMLWLLVGSTLISLVIAIITGTVLGKNIASSTAATLDRAEAIADGDLSGSDVTVNTNDEMKDLAVAINKMQSNLRTTVQSIAANAQNVANASEEFSSVSQQISANSEETSAQAGAVSAATEQMNRNIQTVATATEEMSASIQEIAKNSTEAAKIAAEAMTAARETNAIVSKLGQSSAEIGQVIKVITSIAQKTDLLALNATVEAARAGDVGAGFAVVANEVKELAKQTATATEDISAKIETIQTDAKHAVDAINTISGIIDKVNQISATIASAVEEQSATTNEMSRNLMEAAKGSGEVAQNIHGVAEAAQNTSQGATDSQKASRNLAEMSTQLRELVGQFKLETNGHTRASGGNGRARQDSRLVGVGAE